MKVYGFSQPHPQETISGDAWLALECEDGMRIAVVDGSGHGPAAAEAADAALTSLRATAAQPIEAALRACHEALRGTRGAAISLADVRQDGLRFGGIGNVEGRVITEDGERRVVPQRGIAGVVAPRLRSEAVAVSASKWALLLHTDGITQRLRVKWTTVAAAEPEALVAAAVRDWGRLTDDATVVLVLVP